MTMSTPALMASSTTAATGSTARRMLRTGSAGSPQMSPLESQEAARPGGAAASTRATTSPTVRWPSDVLREGSWPASGDAGADV